MIGVILGQRVSQEMFYAAAYVQTGTQRRGQLLELEVSARGRSTASAKSCPVSASVPSKSNITSSMGLFISAGFLTKKDKPQSLPCQFTFRVFDENDIGWARLLEVKVCNGFFELQRQHSWWLSFGGNAPGRGREDQHLLHFHQPRFIDGDPGRQRGAIL